MLVDGDLTVTESVSIVLYLAERDAHRRFLPRDIALRSEVYRWLMFAATELEQPLWRIARHTALYPEDMRLPAELPIARQDFAEMAAVLERHMKDRQFVVGDQVTVADFVMAYTLDCPADGRGDGRGRQRDRRLSRPRALMLWPRRGAFERAGASCYGGPMSGARSSTG